MLFLLWVIFHIYIVCVCANVRVRVYIYIYICIRTCVVLKDQIPSSSSCVSRFDFSFQAWQQVHLPTGLSQ